MGVRTYISCAPDRPRDVHLAVSAYAVTTKGEDRVRTDRGAGTRGGGPCPRSEEDLTHMPPPPPPPCKKLQAHAKRVLTGNFAQTVRADRQGLNERE